MNSPSETRPESILGKRARDGSSTVTVTPINKKSKQGAASVSYPVNWISHFIDAWCSMFWHRRQSLLTCSPRADSRIHPSLLHGLFLRRVQSLKSQIAAHTTKKRCHFRGVDCQSSIQKRHGSCIQDKVPSRHQQLHSFGQFDLAS